MINDIDYAFAAYDMSIVHRCNKIRQTTLLKIYRQAKTSKLLTTSLVQTRPSVSYVVLGSPELFPTNVLPNVGRYFVYCKKRTNNMKTF